MTCSSGIFLTSMPPMPTEPPSASQNEAMRRATVDFPDPEGPTRAVMACGSIASDMPWSTSSFPYPKLTLSNVMR